ncbi:LacI family DNA-binding transcriptional regulator [Chelativorans sp.]|uniref:LacI family DNA-binding transcriptional regulator n=1 Tax=Chelativorans sp. TaxID=2203393 RepID=UPI002811274A|nr:LacI family DNA-binding transcriptional regulator [Chelativorans sp.]
MRPTIAMIAQMAGVSATTVDRVLNGRGRVKSRTREQVLRVAQETGYLDKASAPVAAPVLLDFILPEGQSSFIETLASHLRGAAENSRVPVTPRIRFFDRSNPEGLATQILSLKGKSQGIGVVAVDLPEVREAIRQVAAAGIPVLNMVSDLTNVPKIGYVGIDNRAAGRLAGLLLSRLIKSETGKIAVFAGSLAYRGHEEREMGFRHFLSEETRLEVVEMREVRDNVETMHQEALALLKRHPDLAGIYNIGGGNRGIAMALMETGCAGKVVFIGHELTEHSRQFLLRRVMDAVIDQNPRVEARDAIELLAHAARGEPQPNLPPIRIQVVFRENIPQV